MEGWSTNDFDDAAWYPVELVNAPEGKLQAQENPNIKVMEHIKPSLSINWVMINILWIWGRIW